MSDLQTWPCSAYQILGRGSAGVGQVPRTQACVDPAAVSSQIMVFETTSTDSDRQASVCGLTLAPTPF